MRAPSRSGQARAAAFTSTSPQRPPNAIWFPELATIFSPRKPVLVSSEGCSYGSSKGRDYGGDWLRSEKIEGFNLPLRCLSSMFDLRE